MIWTPKLSLLSVCIISCFLSLRSQAQDIFFTNMENKPVFNYLDTSVEVIGKLINVNIGPPYKRNDNTIFFNKLFRLKHDQIKSFRIGGSFLQNFQVDSCNFLQSALLIDSTDFDTLFITNSLFKSSVIFRHANIQNLHFSKNDVPQQVSFIDCKIENLTMSNSRLNGVSFSNCTLGNLDFQWSSFDSTLNLSNNVIPGKVNFDYCAFVQHLNLSSLHTSTTTQFSFISTILPDTLDFSGNVSIANTIDFTKVSAQQALERKCRLMLQGTDLSKLRLNYNYFKLVFPKEMTVDEKENIYEGLLQNFKSNAYQQSYTALDIEYRRFHAKQGTFGFLWWIPEYWWLYGYDKGKVFKITFWALLIFTVINFLFLNYLISNIYPVKNIPAYFRKRSWSRVWFSFVYTCIIFFSLSLKVDNINFQKKRGSIYLMFVYVFGIICLAYMANYIIQR